MRATFSLALHAINWEEEAYRYRRRRRRRRRRNRITRHASNRAGADAARALFPVLASPKNFARRQARI